MRNLDCAGDDPAGSGRDDRRPPCDAVAFGALGHEAQDVDLLADLSDEREDDASSGAGTEQIEPFAVPTGADIPGPRREARIILKRDEHERGQVEQHPDGLGPHLKAADPCNAVGHDRDHHDSADDVADGHRQAEAQLERQSHDDGFYGEKDERERGVDQRSDGRSDVAESGPARQQIDIDAVARGVVGDRQAGQEYQQRNREHGGDSILEAVAQRDGAADGFESKKRYRSERSVADTYGRPATCLLRGEAERVVLERLVGDPLIVAPADRNDPEPISHSGDHPVGTFCRSAKNYTPAA